MQMRRPLILRCSLLPRCCKKPSRGGRERCAQSIARGGAGQTALVLAALLQRHAVHVARRVAYKQQQQPEPPRCGERTEDRHDRLRVVSLRTHNPRRLQLAPTDARQRITTRHHHWAGTRRTRSLTPTPRILHRTVPCSPPSMVLFTAPRRLSPRAARLNHN